MLVSLQTLLFFAPAPTVRLRRDRPLYTHTSLDEVPVEAPVGVELAVAPDYEPRVEVRRCHLKNKALVPRLTVRPQILDVDLRRVGARHPYQFRLRLDGVRVLEAHGRLARGLHFDARRDALYHILVGGGERQQCGEGDDGCYAAEAPPGPRRPAGAAVPTEAVAGVAAITAAAAPRSFHAFLGGPAPVELA